MTIVPKHLDLQRESGLHIEWDDGSSTFYPVAFLRRMEENPLAILPSTPNEPLTVTDIQLVGNYAVRFIFSDGHSAGIYSWEYLFNLEPPNDG